MITELDTAERVHYAMCRGIIARISMAQCAHTWGQLAVEAYNRSEGLRGDIKTASDVLMDFEGSSIWQQAQAAVEKIDWLKNELLISQYNEGAAHAVAQQDRRELERARLLLARCATIMRCNDPLNARDLFGEGILTEPNEEGFTDVEEARQTSGPAGPVEKRKDDEAY